jgi:hypothetical protein
MVGWWSVATCGGVVDRLLVALDSSVGVAAEDLALVWREDPEAAVLGEPSVGRPGGEVFLPGLLELVVVPLAVNVASTVLYELVRRLVVRSKGKPPAEVADLELVESSTAAGDRVVVVRMRSVRS